MSRLGITLVLLLTVAEVTNVRGGNNGMAMTPPMSWRSWNQYGWYINESIILSAAAGLVDKSRSIVGMPAGTSLKDLGYGGVGMDEGWAACQAAPGNPSHGRDPGIDPRASMKRQHVPGPFPIGDNKTAMFHMQNIDGTISPVVDKLVFPDMKSLVDKVHSMGLRAGWYLNDCLSYCASISDDCTPDDCIPGDVKAWVEFGFDDLKIDGCSAQRDPELWATLINISGTHAMIENCHNGPAPSIPVADGGCPFYHQYRTSGDIFNAYESFISNAQTVQEYAESHRTGPTCWAYPDMLMIGVQGETPDEPLQGSMGPWYNFTQPSIAEQRTHFGLWCTLSSPLTLSLDFTNKTAVDSVWPIISNTHAIDVNQQWAGYAGGVFAQASSNVTLGEGHRAYQVPTWQAWYKPLPHGTAAVFVANHGDESVSVNISFSDIPSFIPQQSTCPSSQFPLKLGDVRCWGLGRVTGIQPTTPEECCAACALIGETCQTWNFCPPHEPCETDSVSGCYVGKVGQCDNTTTGWISAARGPGPIPPGPPNPPAKPVLGIVTDVWEQQKMEGARTWYAVPTLKSHDSMFITITRSE